MDVPVGSLGYDANSVGDQERPFVHNQNSGPENDMTAYHEVIMSQEDNQPISHEYSSQEDNRHRGLEYSFDRNQDLLHVAGGQYAPRADQMAFIQHSRSDYNSHVGDDIANAAAYPCNIGQEDVNTLSYSLYQSPSGHPPYYNHYGQPEQPIGTMPNDYNFVASDQWSEQQPFEHDHQQPRCYGAPLWSYEVSTSGFMGIHQSHTEINSLAVRGLAPLSETAPWSPENLSGGRAGMPPADSEAYAAETSAASRTSDAGGYFSNSVSGSTESVETQDYEQLEISQVTIRPDYDIGDLPHPDRSRQSFRNSSERLMQGGAPRENDYVWTGPRRPQRVQSFRNGRHRSTGPYQASGSGNASPASSTTSGTIHCPHCSAKFSGAHRRGNRGRHNRDKHGAEVRTYPCDHCEKVFKRTDARLKHHRRDHAAAGPIGV
ncbi:hypothetical protein BDW02DRAFT_577021 [Decorospora gaudefroyi]|uniref:C2H2-type domain-containing protein n=1 Tax=Decorospora gaudefroyi TaxID=184978 RepID=A0A6A5KSX5_9PLEO|nr:hypothetical protein BDW02DRAFT_577021 [Decorospora gaudefroyi]